MRRSTRLGLAAAGLLFVAAAGAYSAFWFVTAGRIEAGFTAWSGSLAARNLDLSWRAMRVGGFPFAFRLALTGAQLRDAASAPQTEIAAPRLAGSARPWNPFVWRLVAPDGLRAVAGPADDPKAALRVERAAGSVAIGSAGGATAWLSLAAPRVEAGRSLAAHSADLWLSLPARAPQSDADPAFGVALALHTVTLPVAPAPLSNPLDDFSLGMTLRGPIPALPPRRAAEAWRDAGGTLDLDHFALSWSGIAVTGSGTLALDADLQPIASVSGTIEGYDALIAALVAAGRLPPGEARLARLALGMLAKPGADGRPQIATSFTVQDGEMYLGPVKLGKAPRIAWP